MFHNPFYNNVIYYNLCKLAKNEVSYDAIIVVRNAKIVVACISGLCYNRCMKIRIQSSKGRLGMVPRRLV